MNIHNSSVQPVVVNEYRRLERERECVCVSAALWCINFSIQCLPYFVKSNIFVLCNETNLSVICIKLTIIICCCTFCRRSCSLLFIHLAIYSQYMVHNPLVLNHISSHFLIPLSDNTLICTVGPTQWLVILDTVITFTFKTFSPFKWSFYCSIVQTRSDGLAAVQWLSSNYWYWYKILIY